MTQASALPVPSGGALAAFSRLRIPRPPNPEDPFHVAIVVAFDGAQDAHLPAVQLEILSAVISREITRQGLMAAALKTEAEKFESAEVLRMTDGPGKVSVALALRHVHAGDAFSRLQRDRREAEARVVGLRHYAGTVERMQMMHQTDRADRRAADTINAHGGTP